MIVIGLPLRCHHEDERRVRPTFTNVRNFLSFDFIYPYRVFARSVLPPHSSERAVNTLAEELAEVGQRAAGLEGQLSQFRKWVATGHAKDRVLICGLGGQWCRSLLSVLEREYQLRLLDPCDLANEATVHAAIDRLVQNC